MRYVQAASVALSLLAAAHALTLVVLQFSDVWHSWAEFFEPQSWQVPVVLSAIIVSAALPAFVAWFVFRGRRTWRCVTVLGVSFVVVPSLFMGLACLATLIWLVAPKLEPAA